MKYILKKIFTFLITVLLVTLFVFLAFELIPGDAATAKLGTNATPEALEAMRKSMGLDKPMLVRFYSWIKSFFFGDMGTSFSYGMNVRSMLSAKLPITLAMTIISFIMIIGISIPLGIYSVKHDGSAVSRILNVLNQLTMSIPPFFIGIIITYLLGLVFNLFVPGGYVSYDVNFGKFVYYLIFPSLAIALPKAAMSMKLLRTSILDEAGKDYVRTAYSRGNSTGAVLKFHVLKNAIIPVITFLGMTLADIVAGSLIVEQVFAIPGFGRLLISSISQRDYPVVQAIIAIVAIIVITINLLVDILYRFIDPRIRRSAQ